MLIDSEILRSLIINDREQCRETYNNNNMLMKGFGRSLMFIEELEKETQASKNKTLIPKSECFGVNEANPKYRIKDFEEPLENFS